MFFSCQAGCTHNSLLLQVEEIPFRTFSKLGGKKKRKNYQLHDEPTFSSKCFCMLFQSSNTAVRCNSLYPCICLIWCYFFFSCKVTVTFQLRPVSLVSCEGINNLPCKSFIRCRLAYRIGLTCRSGTVKISDWFARKPQKTKFRHKDEGKSSVKSKRRHSGQGFVLFTKVPRLVTRLDLLEPPPPLLVGRNQNNKVRMWSGSINKDDDDGKGLLLQILGKFPDIFTVSDIC